MRKSMPPHVFRRIFLLAALVIVVSVALIFSAWRVFLPGIIKTPENFNGDRAYQDVLTQVSFGPRLPGSQAHEQTVAWMLDELDRNGWETELQETIYEGQNVRNVIGKNVETIDPDKLWIVLGAHFDSRIYADNDPDPANHTQPVMGANDGASGVAVLLELARTLPNDLDVQIWLVFFDAEDNGRIPGWDWILGSRAFVESLQEQPDAAVIVDMIGDADLNIHLEKNSDLFIRQQIWDLAAQLGYTEFIHTEKYRILDDHIPFIEAGIRAVDIIDFDYVYWHTIEDTADKVSPNSLKVVGDTLWHWLQTDLNFDLPQ